MPIISPVLPFTLAIGLSGFLIFEVQPMMGKFLLPVFGGSVTSWSVCIAFFQTALLAGYLYAHLLSRFTVRMQAMIHAAVLLASLIVLPVVPSATATAAQSAAPSLDIMWMLGVSVGIPYFVLASTSSLLQRWFSTLGGGADPTRLFAISNLASFAGLLSYPFVFERLASISTQALWWSGGYAIYVAVLLFCAWLTYRRSDEAAATVLPTAEDAVPVSWQDAAVWVGLSLLGSILLLATTNIITERIAAMPFLWVIPLSLYLWSFVIVFGHGKQVSHRVMFVIFLALFALGLALNDVEDTYLLLLKIVALVGAMFAGCLVAHGELASRRPVAVKLTAFYLWMTFGGALGGMLVTFLAPAIFSDYWEYEIGIAALVITVLLLERRKLFAGSGRMSNLAYAGLVVLAAAGILGASIMVREEPGIVVKKVRNFYGVLTLALVEKGDADERLAVFQSAVNQGEQYRDPKRRSETACDFDEQSGIGLAIRRHPNRLKAQPLRVGIVGLGVGMTLVHGHAGDTFRYFEINPAITEVARNAFSFIKDTPATVEVEHGDGRLLLDRENRIGAPKFDVLVIDAFRGAAPPMHLMTKEAFDIYLGRLNPDGILVANFEVERFDPSPLFRGLGAAFNLKSAWFESTLLPGCQEEAVSWALYARQNAFFEDAEVKARISPWWDRKDTKLLWTDQTSNLFSIINW